ncbi:MAG: potassium channel protein [Planctomycetes bacterium]|nr:potassium channel protein [Planctomycetota bacterium]
MRENRRRVLHASLALFGVVLFGTSGFMLIQDEWGFWKSIYFTLITITTVGYGDYGLSAAGERFTSLLLVVGIGTATYALGQFIQTIIAIQLDWRRKMQKKIDAMRDHFVLCGLGRVGKAVAANLAASGRPFVIVDTDEKVCEWARMRGYAAINGCATEDETMFQSGIERAAGVVCSAKDDAQNIVMTLTARELNPGINIVSRAGEEDSIHKLRRAGATRVVAPELIGGQDIASMLTKPHLADFLENSRAHDSDFALSEIEIQPGSTLAEMTFREYGATEQSLVFVAVKKSGSSTQLRPAASDRFGEGDVVIVVGEPDVISRMSALAQAAVGELVAV